MNYFEASGHFDLQNLEALHLQLKNHEMYKSIKNFDQLKIFMESHVFAVWDFMSLLKRLQRELTCVEIPWRPSPYPKKVVRLINSIVLGEESDVGIDGDPIDHFTLYLQSMDEVGASYINLIHFMENLDFQFLSPAQKDFVQFNLNLAANGKIHEVAAAFFFGREKLIPDMFTSLLNDLKSNFENEKNNFKNLIYYLERHIEIDGGEHSHHALLCLNHLCDNNNERWLESFKAGIQSLELRIRLWDEVQLSLK